MTSIRFMQVGGCVRDRFIDPLANPKDIDFACEVNGCNTVDEAFGALITHLDSEGFTIFLAKPEFFIVRAKFPKGHDHAGLVADFVLCRKDGPSTNARHPDFVLPGTIMDDLARRDFTLNAFAQCMNGEFIDPFGGAIAQSMNGEVIDPFGGRKDIADRIIRFVGDPMERLREDSLRALRGLRFSITKGFILHPDTFAAINDPAVIPLLASVSTERVREELDKMFRASTLETLDLLCHSLNREFLECLFDNGLRLMPTQAS
jgi:tRNA nucleotidyltransferase/poly(A) polymerase